MTVSPITTAQALQALHTVTPDSTSSPVSTTQALQALHTVAPTSPNVPQSAVPDSGGSQSAQLATQKANAEAAQTLPPSADPNRGRSLDISV